MTSLKKLNADISSPCSNSASQYPPLRPFLLILLVRQSQISAFTLLSLLLLRIILPHFLLWISLSRSTCSLSGFFTIHHVCPQFGGSYQSQSVGFMLLRPTFMITQSQAVSDVFTWEAVTHPAGLWSLGVTGPQPYLRGKWRTMYSLPPERVRHPHNTNTQSRNEYMEPTQEDARNKYKKYIKWTWRGNGTTGKNYDFLQT